MYTTLKCTRASTWDGLGCSKEAYRSLLAGAALLAGIAVATAQSLPTNPPTPQVRWGKSAEHIGFRRVWRGGRRALRDDAAQSNGRGRLRVLAFLMSTFGD